METDISLENEEKKIIIDAKYYKETMTVNYDKERIRSSNLYQLFSYLLNQQDGSEKLIWQLEYFYIQLLREIMI